MAISIELIRSFVAVAENENISKAAKIIGMTQPALSMAIQKLEHDLKAVVFIRTKKGVVLTRAGKILLARSGALLREWEGLGKAIEKDKVDISGLYSIGMFANLASMTLPKFLPKIMHKHPRLEFSFKYLSAKEILECLLNYELDFGIIMNPVMHNDLEYVGLFGDTVKLYRARDYSLKTNGDAHSDIIVCHSKMPQCHYILDKLSEEQCIENYRILHIDDLQVIASLVSSGIGLGILPKAFVHNSLFTQLVPFDNSPYYNDRCFLVTRKNLENSNATKHIKNSIVKYLK